MNKESLSSSPTHFPVQFPIGVLRKTLRALLSYDDNLRRAARADHDYQLLWHQSDAELNKRGLRRSTLTRAIYTKHFASN